MAKISADIAQIVDITARRSDSFYLQVALSNDDGTTYNLIDSASNPYEADMFIYDSTDRLILTFESNNYVSGVPGTLSDAIVIDTTKSTLTIEVLGSNMGLHTGNYKYKLVLSSDTDDEVNTVMVGKLKIIDL
tara:strand:- start:6432 stop:6830 length:399 start_codon:yes stop_codon:yes gene_type:complete